MKIASTRANDARRHAGDDRVGGNVLRDERTGRDDGALADLHPGQDLGPASQERAVTDLGRREARRERRVIDVVIAPEEPDAARAKPTAWRAQSRLCEICAHEARHCEV